MYFIVTFIILPRIFYFNIIMFERIINTKLVNQGLLIGFTIFLIALKIIADTFFYIFTLTDNSFFTIWKIVISLAVIILLYFYFEIRRVNSEQYDTANENNTFFSELTVIMMMILILLITSGLLPTNMMFSFSIENVLQFAFIEAVSVYALITGFNFIFFFFKWLNIRKHKRTDTYIWVLSLLFWMMLIVELINTLIIRSNPDKTINFLTPVFSVLIILISFLAAKRNNWIAGLSGGRKWRLIGTSIVMIFISAIIASLSLDSNNEGRLYHSLMISYGAGSLLTFPSLMSIGYFSRVLLVTIFALPTSRIVEQRSYEISSLTYLNKVVASTSDTNTLLETVTNLAMNSSGANAAWTEIYENKNEVRIASIINIDEEVIKNFHAKSDIRNYFISIREPLFIETVKDCRDNLLGDICNILHSKSLIAIPLLAGDDRVGTLIVLHPEEYSFEKDYINLLSAFSDNINIALENSRLFNESVEKEKYKQEMMLAKEIETKLLPQKIPSFSHFSIDAFSIPAEEVGGDYYDIVHLKNGLPCVLIGDVSGKGMSAAFYMALLKGVVISVAKESCCAEDLLCKINSTLFGRMEKQMFITLSAITFDDHNGTVKLARAGHTPFIIKKDSEIFTSTPKGIGIGLANNNLFDSVIEELDMILAPNDVILLYSDGITELRNPDGSEFDENSLKQILELSVYNNAGELVDNIKAKINDFSGGNISKDDMTILALHYI